MSPSSSFYSSIESQTSTKSPLPSCSVYYVEIAHSPKSWATMTFPKPTTKGFRYLIFVQKTNNSYGNNENNKPKVMIVGYVPFSTL